MYNQAKATSDCEELILDLIAVEMPFKKLSEKYYSYEIGKHLKPSK